MSRHLAKREIMKSNHPPRVHFYENVVFSETSLAGVEFFCHTFIILMDARKKRRKVGGWCVCDGVACFQAHFSGPPRMRRKKGLFYLPEGQKVAEILLLPRLRLNISAPGHF